VTLHVCTDSSSTIAEQVKINVACVLEQKNKVAYRQIWIVLLACPETSQFLDCVTLLSSSTEEGHHCANICIVSLAFIAWHASVCNESALRQRMVETRECM
jgi:hypothetical protein